MADIGEESTIWTESGGPGFPFACQWTQQQPAAGGIPQADPIITHRRDLRSVGAKIHASHPVRMFQWGENRLTRLYIPKADSLVRGGGGQTLAVGAKRNA